MAGGTVNSTSNKSNILVSVIIPARNESESIVELRHAILRLMSAGSEFELLSFEFVVIDNASTDDTWNLLTTTFQDFPNIRLYRHITNLGLQGSIFSGLSVANGDAAVVLQSDLQDPPEIIIKMVRNWINGDLYVTTKIIKRNSGFFDRQTRTFAYLFLNLVAGVRVEVNSGDFWLIDRSLIDQLTAQSSLRPFFRTAIPKIRKPDSIIGYDRAERKSGKTNFNFLGKYEFFVDALVSDARRFSMLMFMSTSFLFLISFLLLIVWVPILLSSPPPRIHHFANIFTGIGLFGFAFALILFPLTLIIEYIQRIYTSLPVYRRNDFQNTRETN